MPYIMSGERNMHVKVVYSLNIHIKYSPIKEDE